ncbi:MAG: hypothetical protein M3Q89_00365 [Verrucomicrobiota bacterium]|nr:hypothetical protein [Verrucomicrobiota bacterium]
MSFTGASISTGIGSVSNAVGSGTTQATIDLNGVASGQTITINLAAVNDGVNTNDVTVRMAVLIGDTTANGTVNSSDIAQSKAGSGQAIAASNFRTDVTVNRTINSSDISLVKSKSGTGTSL